MFLVISRGGIGGGREAMDAPVFAEKKGRQTISMKHAHCTCPHFNTRAFISVRIQLFCKMHRQASHACAFVTLLVGQQ